MEQLKLPQPEFKKIERSLFQIDAFATEVFRGNLSAICPLRSWLHDGVLQAAARESHRKQLLLFKNK